MKTVALSALVLMLPAATLLAADKKTGVSISLSSSDSDTKMGSRHSAREARLAIASRDGTVILMLLNDVVALQLTDRALSDVHSKEDAGFFEELLASGVRMAVGKSVEYPIAKIRTVELRNGELRMIGDDDKPVFSEVKVNGTDVLRDFPAADATRFIAAFQRVKASSKR